MKPRAKQQSVQVSVIMPAFNVERYIGQAIQSVLKQRGVSFELLIADDASTDKTWEQIQAYQAEPSIRTWRFQAHRGAAATRNHLIRQAQGRYLSLCDSDDLMLPGNLRRLASILKRRSRVGVVNGPRLLLDRKGRSVLDPKSLPSYRWGWDLLKIQLFHPGAMLRKSLVEKVGGYNAALPFSEDQDLFLRLVEVSEFKALGGQPVYLYRRRSDSLSQKPKASHQRVATGILREAISRRYGVKVSW